MTHDDWEFPAFDDDEDEEDFPEIEPEETPEDDETEGKPGGPGSLEERLLKIGPFSFLVRLIWPWPWKLPSDC
jgi:hypothetical protein